MATIGQPVDPNDPWSVASGNAYDLTNFYIRSTDGKGHSENIQVKISTAMAGAINALIREDVVPYRTIQDFVRDAIVHRAKWLSDNKRTLRIDPIASADAFMAKLEQVKQERLLVVELVETAQRQFDEAVRVNDRQLALDIMLSLEQIADTWADKPDAYRRMTDTIDTQRNTLRLNAVRDTRPA